MEPDGTEVTTSGKPHQLVYMCRQHYKKKSHMNKKQNTEGLRNSSTSVHLYCAHAAGVSREVTKASDKQQTM